MRRKVSLAAILLFTALSARAATYQDETQPSTAPIGSSFYRHLAADMSLDIKELVKFEKKGFGRGEIITLVLISSHTHVPLKDYGKRRIKDKVPLKDLAVEAKMDYDELYKKVRVIKAEIEAKGDNNLPPPVFETPPPTPTPKPKKEKKKKT